MSNSAINQGVLQAKVNNVQNVGDSSAVCSTTGDWSFKNATATATNVFISNAGNVGIGTTSPRGLLEASTASETNVGVFGRSGLSQQTIQTDSTINLLGGQADGNGPSIVFNHLNVSNGVSTGKGARIVGFRNNAGTDRAMGIDFKYADGNGTTQQAMRVDASGNLLVGAASAYNALAKLQVISSGANNGMLATTDVAPQSPYLSWNRATSGNNIFLYCTTETTGSFGTERGSIYYDRAANQTKIAATSDERLKTNIKDAPSLLEKVCAIKVREYAWKETGSENIGFIAQELNAVVPRAVWEGEDNEDGTIKRPWSVDNPTLVPYLVKAIQELSAKVEEQSLRLEAQAAEIEALKAS